MKVLVKRYCYNTGKAKIIDAVDAWYEGQDLIASYRRICVGNGFSIQNANANSFIAYCREGRFRYYLVRYED